MRRCSSSYVNEVEPDGIGVPIGEGSLDWDPLEASLWCSTCRRSSGMSLEVHMVVVERVKLTRKLGLLPRCSRSDENYASSPEQPPGNHTRDSKTGSTDKLNRRRHDHSNWLDLPYSGCHVTGESHPTARRSRHELDLNDHPSSPRFGRRLALDFVWSSRKALEMRPCCLALRHRFRADPQAEGRSRPRTRTASFLAPPVRPPLFPTDYLAPSSPPPLSTQRGLTMRRQKNRDS